MTQARLQRAAILSIHTNIQPWQIDLLTPDEEAAIFDQLNDERQ